jgi:hypothetical protein
MPRKFQIRRAILQTKRLARLALRTQTRGADTGAEGAAVEAEVAAGAEATRRKNGIASSTRRMMITAQTTAQTRKDLRLFSRRKGRRRRGPIP